MKLCRRTLCQRLDAVRTRLRSPGYVAMYLYIAAFTLDTERVKGLWCRSLPASACVSLRVCRNVPLHWKRAAGLGVGGWRSVATLEARCQALRKRWHRAQWPQLVLLRRPF